MMMRHYAVLRDIVLPNGNRAIAGAILCLDQHDDMTRALLEENYISLVDPFPVTAVHATPIKLALEEAWPEEEMYFLREVSQVECWQDQRLKAMVVRLTTGIPAILKDRVKVDVKYPKNWVEAVKERWAPKWYLRKHPVQYETIFIDQPIYERVCPHIGADPHKSHVEFLVHEN